MPKHIAMRGAKTGQWVNCVAPVGQCRNGGANGMHVESTELYKVALWKAKETGQKYVPLNALGAADAINYRALSDEEKKEFDAQWEKKRAERIAKNNSRNRLATYNNAPAKATPEQDRLREKARNHYVSVKHDDEVSRTKTTVTMKNGQVLKRVPRGYSDLQASQRLAAATRTLIAKWERGLTVPEVKEYFKTLQESPFFNNNTEVWEQIYAKTAAGFLTPSTRPGSYNFGGGAASATFLNSASNTIASAYYGFDPNEYSQYSANIKEEEKASKIKQKTSVSPIVEKETELQKAETKTASTKKTLFNNLKGWVKSWKYTED